MYKIVLGCFESVQNRIFVIFAIVILGCIYKTSSHEYVYLGCYEDDKTRVLPALKLQDKNNMSNLICITYCQVNNYTFAGTENARQCFCGNGDKVSDDLKRNESDCVQTCKGHSDEICGGKWRLSVYKQQRETEQTTETAAHVLIESTSEKTEQTTETTAHVSIESTSEKTEQTTETTTHDLIESTSEKTGQTTETTTHVLNGSISEKTGQTTETTAHVSIESSSAKTESATDTTAHVLIESTSEKQSLETTQTNLIGSTSDGILQSNTTEDILPGCHCPCEKMPKYTNQSMTDRYLQQIIEDISVQKTTTNKYLRLKTSASDDRDSSQIIGTLGIVAIFTCIIYFILGDCVAICRFFKNSIVSLMVQT